jgi:hypothetical protein
VELEAEQVEEVPAAEPEAEPAGVRAEAQEVERAEAEAEAFHSTSNQKNHHQMCNMEVSYMYKAVLMKRCLLYHKVN